MTESPTAAGNSGNGGRCLTPMGPHRCCLTPTGPPLLGNLSRRTPDPASAQSSPTWGLRVAFWATPNARTLVQFGVLFLTFLTHLFTPKFPKMNPSGKARGGPGLTPGVHVAGVESVPKPPFYLHASSLVTEHRPCPCSLLRPENRTVAESPRPLPSRA